MSHLSMVSLILGQQLPLSQVRKWFEFDISQYFCRISSRKGSGTGTVLVSQYRDFITKKCHLLRVNILK